MSHPAGNGEWLRACDSTSEFALWFAVLNGKFSAGPRYRANAQVSDAGLEAIARTYPRLAFADAEWPAYPTRFYGERDVLIELNGTWVWVAALTEDALEAVEMCWPKSATRSKTTTAWTETAPGTFCNHVALG